MNEFIDLMLRSFLPYMVGQRQNLFTQVVLHAYCLEDIINQPRQPILSASKPFIRGKPKEIIAQTEVVRQTYRPIDTMPLQIPRTTYRVMSASIMTNTNESKKQTGAQCFPQRINQSQPLRPVQQFRPRKMLEEMAPTPNTVNVMFFRLKDMDFLKTVDPKETNSKSIGYSPKGVCHYHS